LERTRRKHRGIIDGYRGAPYLVKDQAGNTKCVSCQLCEFVCPPKAIRIVPPGPAGQLADRPNAEKMPAEFEINMLRCIFCGFCEESCPVDSIVETHILEYHGEKRGDLYFTKDMLLAVGDRYEGEIAAAKAADAKYR